MKGHASHSFSIGRYGQLCFTCPLRDCVGIDSQACPIWAARHIHHQKTTPPHHPPAMAAAGIYHRPQR